MRKTLSKPEDFPLKDQLFTGKTRPVTVMGTLPIEKELFFKLLAVLLFAGSFLLVIL